jgi:hypothetical protein
MSDDVRARQLGARRARHLVLERFGDELPAFVAREEARYIAILGRHLGDEADLGAKGEREMLGETLKEFLTHRSRRAFGHEQEEVLPKRARVPAPPSTAWAALLNRASLAANPESADSSADCHRKPSQTA